MQIYWQTSLSYRWSCSVPRVVVGNHRVQRTPAACIIIPMKQVGGYLRLESRFCLTARAHSQSKTVQSRKFGIGNGRAHVRIYSSDQWLLIFLFQALHPKWDIPHPSLDFWVLPQLIHESFNCKLINVEFVYPVVSEDTPTWYSEPANPNLLNSFLHTATAMWDPMDWR